MHDSSPTERVHFPLGSKADCYSRWGDVGAPLVQFLAPQFAAPAEEAAHAAAPGFVPILSIVIALAGLAIGWLGDRERRDPDLGWIERALRRHWFLVDLYDGVLTPAARRLALALAGPVDLGVIDRAVNGVGALVAGGARALRRLQTGYVRQYAAVILIGTILLVAYWVTR